jgi:hypothetical protein
VVVVAVEQREGSTVMSNQSRQPQPILTYDQFRDLYRNLIVVCRYDQHKAGELAKSFIRKGLVATL